MLTGSTAQLDRMTARLSELASVPSRTAKAVSSELTEVMQEGFDDGTDPYGSPWAPLAEATLDKGRSPPPLTDSAAMRGSLVVRPLAGAGVGITIAHPAGVHQTGWTGPRGDGPARPILPAQGELPEAWAEIVEDAAEREFRR